VLRGDLGESYTYRIPVISLLSSRAGATLLLALASLIMTWIIAFPLGILGAIRQNTLLDRMLRGISYLGQSIPSFVLAILLLMGAQQLGWFPVGGMTSSDYQDLPWWGKVLDISWHLILPTLALSLSSIASLQRITRGSFLDVLRQDYIQAGRARGLSENRLIWIHALRNAVNPLITILGFELAGLLSGSFVTEFFFNWPGMGKLLLESVRSFDLNVVMAGLLLGALMLIGGNPEVLNVDGKTLQSQPFQASLKLR
jgi:peptide/nickel transport system permease protein